MVRKAEEISRGRCSVCGQPAPEDWQKYMAPRCAAHPHTATGRMVAGEEPEPTNPATGQPYFKVPAEGWGTERHTGKHPALAADYGGLEPVIYVDNRGQLVSRVSDEQVEAVLGPHVDRIRTAMAGHAEIAGLRSALELARNGLAWYRDAYPEADSGADDEMMETIAVALGEAHDLYTDADKDRPDVICDSNGQVVLGLCKRCGKGEAELHNEDGTPSPCSRA